MSQMGHSRPTYRGLKSTFVCCCSNSEHSTDEFACPLSATSSVQAPRHAFRATNSTGAMRPLDMFWIIFCTLSGVFRPIKI